MRCSLPIDLRRLANHARQCSVLGVGMSPAECGRIAVLLQLGAEEADRVVAQAADVPELEDELLAVAHDPSRVEPQAQSGYQLALKAQQREIQQQLDRGEPVHVSRHGLAALAMPVGDSNVVAFPVAPHPRSSGGDAA